MIKFYFKKEKNLDCHRNSFDSIWTNRFRWNYSANENRLFFLLTSIENKWQPASVWLLIVGVWGRTVVGERWTLDEEDFVALRIDAGTRPWLYLVVEESPRPTAILVDDVASDGGFDVFCDDFGDKDGCWPFRTRIKHQFVASGNDLWIICTRCPLLTESSWEDWAV